MSRLVRRSARPPVQPLPIAVAVVGLVLVAVVAVARSCGSGTVPPGGAGPAGAARVWYSPTLATTGLELAAPVRVQADVPDPNPPSSTSQLPFNVALEFRDAQGRPAIFGAAPAPPQPMILTSQPAVWTADLSAPTVPGVYHVLLTITIPTRPTQTLELTAPPLTVVTPGAPLQSGFVYDRDGNLWLTSADGQRTRKLTFHPRGQPAWQAAWAPDGSRIAYSRSLPVPATELPIYEIWSVRPDGSANQSLVARRPGEDLLFPAWTPDGQHLLVTADRVLDLATGGTPTSEHFSDSQETWSIETVDRAGGARRLLVPDAEQPDVSRDGRRLVYVAAPPARSQTDQIVTHTLMIADADGSHPQVLVPPEHFQDVHMPRFSPDGQWVAFTAVNPEGWEQGARPWLLPLLAAPVAANGVPWDVYLVAAGGGELRRLTHLQADVPTVAWGADAQQLAVLTQDGLYRVPLDGSAPQRVAGGGIHGYLSWYAP